MNSGPCSEVSAVSSGRKKNLGDCKNKKIKYMPVVLLTFCMVFVFVLRVPD